jgi:anti-anti-sigma factor
VEPLKVVRSTVTVKLSGEYDLARVDELRSVLLVPLDGAVTLKVDLTDVTFMDSAALRTLVQTHHLLAERQVWLRLSNPLPSVFRLFDITGTATMFGL